MLYTVQFREDVFSEIHDIYNWYELKSKGLGKIFLDELDSCFKLISSNPFLFQKKIKKFRSALTRRFPYLIIFEIEKENILIYHVRHTSRNPKLKFIK
ncbi:hypothetical protein BH11BAC1_BH11BAC1_08460 [soil metagenome]